MKHHVFYDVKYIKFEDFPVFTVAVDLPTNVD